MIKYIQNIGLETAKRVIEVISKSRKNKKKRRLFFLLFILVIIAGFFIYQESRKIVKVDSDTIRYVELIKFPENTMKNIEDKREVRKIVRTINSIKGV